MKITILAGGSGTRLWPLSRARRPKQFLDLAVSGQSLLQETVERILPLVSGEDILVVTGREFVRQVERQLPQVPPGNIIAEPCGRGSAPAIGLAAHTIMRRWGNEVMVSLHADHHIANPEILCSAMIGAASLARQGRIVTLGIVPTRPHTGLGHVKRGASLGTCNGFAAYTIDRFVEKPPYDLAKQYTESGEYYWNTGMFVWQVETILQEMATHMPALAASLRQISKTPNSARGKAACTRLWRKLGVEQIDFGVMEKTSLGAVIPVDGMGWSDVGDWNSLTDVRAADGDGNVVIGDLVAIDTTNCIVAGAGKRLIATVGLNDMIVVETDDAILVCPRQRAQDVRKLVEKLRAQKKQAYL
jgi:mannose-1-phosphate guanylyltransferase